MACNKNTNLVTNYQQKTFHFFFFWTVFVIYTITRIVREQFGIFFFFNVQPCSSRKNFYPLWNTLWKFQNFHFFFTSTLYRNFGAYSTTNFQGQKGISGLKRNTLLNLWWVLMRTPRFSDFWVLSMESKTTGWTISVFLSFNSN